MLKRLAYDYNPCAAGYFYTGEYCAPDPSSYPGTVYTGDESSSSFWDNLIRTIQAGGTVATNIIRAENAGYYTPQGMYPYGTGPYSGVNYQQAQAYLSARGGTTVTAGGNTFLLLGLGAILLMVLMRRR
jgi:hypothetical protein